MRASVCIRLCVCSCVCVRACVCTDTHLQQCFTYILHRDISSIKAWLVSEEVHCVDSNTNCILFLQMTQQTLFRRRILTRLVEVCSISYLVLCMFHHHMSDFDSRHAGSTHLTILGSRTTEHTNVRSFDKKPRFVDKYNGVWQTVKKYVGVVLFSAFYDNRPGIPERAMIAATICTVCCGSRTTRCH